MERLKNCTKCGEVKPPTSFNKGRAYCKACHVAAASAWARANIERRREIANAYTKRRRERLGPPKKPGRKAFLSAEDRARLMPVWRKKWDEKNRPYILAKTRAYQAKKMKALPAWADRAAISAIYVQAASITEKTGTPHHVDHIVPLQGRDVCGLHVPWNLQIIPARVNWSKGNRV